MNAVHFVRVHDGQAFVNAVRVFGNPDFIHRIWDVRAKQEIVPGDIAIFGKGSDADEPSERTWDASAVECSWCKCSYGECKARK